jgi:hypothetical protein
VDKEMIVAKRHKRRKKDMKTQKLFPLSANGVGGEGRGEVARLNSNPLAPTLSPLRRGEGVDVSVKLRPASSRSENIFYRMQFNFAPFVPFCG